MPASQLTISIALPYLFVLGLMYLGLTANVILKRNKLRIGIGSGKDTSMALAVRVHGNFAEYVPLISLMLIVLELNLTPWWLLHLFWGCLVLGRVIHAQGLSKSAGKSNGRVLGTSLTWLTLLGASVTLLFKFF